MPPAPAPDPASPKSTSPDRRPPSIRRRNARGSPPDTPAIRQSTVVLAQYPNVPSPLPRFTSIVESALVADPESKIVTASRYPSPLTSPSSSTSYVSVVPDNTGGANRPVP